MMPNITRGDRASGLLAYLVGQSTREAHHHSNAHTNPHVVAGHDAIVHDAPAGELTMDDALDIANLLDMPRRVYGTRVTVPVKEWDDALGKKVKVGERDAHVWHASLSIKADEGPLSDAKWGDIARDFVDGMGFTDPDGAGSCRWVAIRHGESAGGNDHIHIAVSLVREDGEKARVHDDFRRAQRLTNELEHKYGLTVLASREQDKSTLRGVTPAELERARRDGDRITQRDELRRRLRSASAVSTNEASFIDQCREHRVLVRPRFGKDDPDKVVGYSAAIVPDVVDGVRQSPIWFAGSKLDRNLGLGLLREQWQSDPRTEGDAVVFWKRRGKPVEKQLEDMPSGLRKRPTPEQIRALNEKHGQTVLPDFSGPPQTASMSPAEVSAFWAHLSVLAERANSGPFAEASNQMAQEAQPPRRGRKVKKPARGDAAYSARLAARATGSGSRAGWAAVQRQASRTASAVADARRERAALVEAERTAQSVTATEAAYQRFAEDMGWNNPIRRGLPAQPVQPQTNVQNGDRARGRSPEQDR